MERNSRQEVLTYLLAQAEKQGYVTFDNIMDCADANSVPIEDFDWLTSVITIRGIIVYDEVPASRTVSNQDDNDSDDYAQSDYDEVYNRIIELDPALKDFVKTVRNIVPPQRRELSVLKYQVFEKNQHARERLIEMYLRIAFRIALRRAEIYDIDIVDTVGEACIGLITAVDKYNPDTNGSFSSYAAMWVLQNISRSQATKRPLIYYPAYKKESFFLAYPILKEYGYVYGSKFFEKEDAISLLCEKLFFTREQAADVVEAATPLESFEELYSDYFEKNQYEDDEDEMEVQMPRELIIEKDLENQVVASMLKEQLEDVLDTLTKKERKVLDLRYGLTNGKEKTLEEIGREFNVTRERIRQIETKAISKLRKPSRSRKLRDFLRLSKNVCK